MRGAWRRYSDAILATAVVLVDLMLFSTLLTERPGSDDAPPWLIIGYALLGGAGLYWRRRAPALVFGALWVHASAAVLLAGYRPTLGLLVALYTIAAHRGTAIALGGLTAMALPVGLVVAHEMSVAAPDERAGTAIGVALFLGLIDCGVWTVGRVVRAARQRAADLERRRLAAAREAVALERARIARELHDIVAHTVTLMSMHAAGAGKVLRRDPERAERALGDVGALGTRAMSELRRMLLVLRDDTAYETPTPLTDTALDHLITAAAAAGVSVTLTRTGEARPLDPSVETTVHRLAQEAVTNTIRHAGPGACATIALRWQPDALTVEIIDDGRGAPDPAARALSTGHGLLGLRERVHIVGGDLETGPVAGGGFRLSAHLPVSAAEASTAEPPALVGG